MKYSMFSKNKIISLFAVVTLLIGTFVFMANANAATDTNKRVVEVEQSWSGTTFHCNTFGGNGRVWPEVGPYNKKHDGKIFLVLEEIPGTTTWRLIDVKDKNGKSLGVPTCPGKHEHCGSSEWISFSNNSGAPDGKNIQLHHSKPVDPPGKITLEKRFDGQLFAKWSTNVDIDPQEIINSMVFELYAVAGDGSQITGVPIAVGRVNPDDGLITFTPGTVPAGWYAVVESLVGRVEDIFERPEPLYIHIEKIGITSSIEDRNINGTFTVQYTTGFAENIQLIYEDGHKISGQKPGVSPVQQLSTEKFEVTLPDKTKAPSFCADLGALNVYGNYKFDSTFHGLTDAQREHLIVAFDYIYATYGLDENPGKALAQIILWNLLDDEGYAGKYYPDSKIAKIEGYGEWYDPYRELVDDILNNPAKYIAMYPNGESSFVSGMVCIVGNDGRYTSINQQRQIFPLFDKIAFYNKVKEGFDSRVPAEKLEMTDLNWNNGNTSNKDGANGAGINSFSLDGIQFKNNKNYVTPENFEAAIAQATGSNIFTVLERTVEQNGEYVKVYDVKVGLYTAGTLKVYGGTITVNNPGGNDKNQKIELVRVK
ncbi:MAG: hypothetical protein LBQ00_03575 [Syntrophobacterales bacterium]|nr:hypothetical protein [Syntrophobacterales bacterium]